MSSRDHGLSTLPARLRRGTADDDGAVAVVVALLLVVLVGVTAFAIDFGLAYNNAQGLQGAADAGAIGAAVDLRDNGVTCENRTGADSLRAAQVGAEIVAANLDVPVASLGPAPVTVRCAGGDLLADAQVTASTGATTGSVLGLETLPAERTATARLEGIPQGLRPMLLCEPEVQLEGALVYIEVRNQPGRTTPFTGYGNFGPSGGCPGLNGSWRRVECPEGPQGGAYGYLERFENGCATMGFPGDILDGRPLPPPPFDRVLSDSIQEYLGRGPLATGERVLMPVICDAANPGCPAYQQPGGGSGATWPIWKLADVTVCYVHHAGVPPVAGVPLCFAETPDVVFDPSSNNALNHPDPLDDYMVLYVHGVYGAGDDFDRDITLVD